MPKVIYVHPDRSQTVVDVPAGTSVMQAAVANGVAGIVAECGGSAMCATCHVYINEPFAARLPPINDVEDAMLDSTICERTDQSRLSCQLIVTEELDGLIVRLPDAQT